MRERVDSATDVHVFTNQQALEALEHIIQTRPRIVALDLEFSNSSRGAALIHRIKADPNLNECEVRVIAHDAALSRAAVRRPTASGGQAVAVDDPKAPLDLRGTRRAPRFEVREGFDVLVDGNVATLVNVSAVGAQVLCATVLRPNQRVRMTLTDEKGVLRCNGSIAWAALELPKGQPPRYRAGIDITGADPLAVAAFGERNQKHADT